MVVITGSYGAGHDSAAREIAERFRWAGARVTVHDIVDLLPFRMGKLTRAAYLKQITRCPESWETTLSGCGRARAPTAGPPDSSARVAAGRSM